MAVIVGFNQKGGSGKTTMVGNLAGEFHAMGLSVATIDLDKQQSLTEWAASGEGLLSRVTLEIPNLHSMTEKAATNAVLDALEQAQGEYDIVLVDTPPLLAGVSMATLKRADLALIPIQPTAKDIRAAHKAIEAAKDAMQGTKLQACTVPYRVAPRTTASRDLPDVLAEFGLPVMPSIRSLAASAECDLVGLTLYEYKPTSPARLEFSELAAECNRLLRKKGKR